MALFSVAEQGMREREYTFFEPREETAIGQGVHEGPRALLDIWAKALDMK